MIFASWLELHSSGIFNILDWKINFQEYLQTRIIITLLLRIEKYHKEQVKVFLALMRSEWNGYRSNVKNDLASISTFEWHLKCKLKKMKVEISGWIRERNLTNMNDVNDHLLFQCILCDYFQRYFKIWFLLKSPNIRIIKME